MLHLNGTIQFLSSFNSAIFTHNSGGGGQGGGRPGEKGAGVREVGEEGAGGGLPKVAGSGRKREKIMQHCTIFRNRKNAKGREPKNTGREPGLKGTGSGRFKPPFPAPPPHTISELDFKFVKSWREKTMSSWYTTDQRGTVAGSLVTFCDMAQGQGKKQENLWFIKEGHLQAGVNL